MVVNSIGLYGYLYIAKDLFHKDKTIYTMNALEINTSNIGNIIDSQIMRATTFLSVIQNLRDNNVRQILESEMPFLVAILSNSHEQPLWVKKGAFQKNKVLTKFLEYRKEYGKLAKNTFIPFSNGYGLFLLENEVGYLTLLINFNQTLETVVKNNTFDISFFSTSVASWLENSRNVSEELLNKIQTNQSNSTKTIVTETKEKIESAYRSQYGVYVIASVLKKDALDVLDQLNSRSFYYFLIFLSTTGLVSVLVTNRLTKGLRQLYDATKDISKGNYDITLEITSKDEVEDLATSFVDMSSKIQQLLNELRKYNEMLEQMVMERTLHLNEALNLQKAMVDSLDEGFFILDENGNVGELRSKATKDIFGRDINGLNLAEIFELEEGKTKLSEFLGVVFAGALHPDVAFELLPNSVFIQGQKLLNVRYSTISQISKNSDLIQNVVAGSDEIANIVCVVSDKTEEYQMEQKLKVEKDFARVVMNVVNDSQKFKNFVCDFLDLLENLDRVVSKRDVSMELYRLVHTYKAHANYLGLETLAEAIHELEDKISRLLKSEDEIFEDWKKFTDNVDKNFRNWLERLELLSGVDKNGRVIVSDFKVPEKSFKNAIESIDRLNLSSDDKFNIYGQLLFVSVKEIIEKYKFDVKKFTEEINDKIELNVVGQDVNIYQPLYKSFFEQLMHVFRNSVDHGYDGKEMVLTADIKVSDKLRIHYYDNGKGLNLAQLKQKLEELNQQIGTDEEVAQAIFLDQLSTAEKVTITSGRGVGMSALKNAVVDMGGSIWVDPAYKGGFSCLIELPLFTQDRILASILTWAKQ